MNKIVLAIICPVYNEEKNISQLIESIENQGCTECELIIINDGSKDNSLNIIKNYEQKYENIVVIDKKNTGVSDSRNIGIKIAKGKYITFVDADDEVSSNYFKKIIPELKKGNFDLLFFNINIWNNKKIIKKQIPNKYIDGAFVELNGVEKYLQGEFCYRIGSGPCNKIYLSQILKNNNIYFNTNLISGEDLVFNMLYVSKIKKYKYIKDALYNYHWDMHSIGNHFENYYNYIDPLKKICNDNNINEQYLKLFFLRRLPGLILDETKNANYRDGKKNLQNYFKKCEIKEILSNITIKHMDYKLIICYGLYKFKLYILLYNCIWLKKIIQNFLHKRGE